MFFLVKRFAWVMGAFCVLFLSVFISFRCGYKKGLEDAPRRFYSVDVATALRENPDFRNYVTEVYSATYRQVLDSVLRTDKLLAVYGQWMDSHPGCAMMQEKKVGIDVKDAEKVFFKGVK